VSGVPGFQPFGLISYWIPGLGIVVSRLRYRDFELGANEANIAIEYRVHHARAIGSDQGLAMAQVRGDAQMPHWSASIRDFRKAGWKISRIAKEFRCSRGTVQNVWKGKGQAYASLSGVRLLTPAQAAPAGMWGRFQLVAKV
jgi:hypothetical protein